ncbi:MAG: hypothetical protein ACRD3M_18705 [Thermoanaerobaculia bacterium]
MNRKTRDKNPAQFALTEETLTDGSKVYGVRFYCDYDLAMRVDLDCYDKAQAEALLAELSATVSGIGVTDMETA